MYLPTHFREDRVEVLHQFIERYPLGSLVAVTADGLRAEHVPVLLDRGAGTSGRLSGHIARANDLWTSVAANTDVLVLFGGPDAYVSPAWYPSKAEHGKVVPTWTYAVVQVRGAIRFFDDPARLHALVASLTYRHEAGRREPWSVDDAPADYVEKQLRAIVGFEIDIHDVIGKFKASQNRSDADRAGVRAGLDSGGTRSVEELVRPPR